MNIFRHTISRQAVHNVIILLKCVRRKKKNVNKKLKLTVE